MTTRYAHLSPAHLAEAVSAIESLEISTTDHVGDSTTLRRSS
jgi:hypothetical protein